jgi:hypothetical protein
MVFIRRPLHLWWLPLVSVACAMFAPAGAAAHEISGRHGSAAVGFNSHHAQRASSGETLILEKGRVDTAFRPDEPGAAIACSGGCADPHAVFVVPDRPASTRLSHTRQDSVPGRVGTDRGAGSARSGLALPLHSHKHRVAFPKFARANDPNDDGTSRDPSDDETSDDYAANDGTSLPVAAWLQDMVRRSIDLETESALAWIETPSAPSLSRHHLRC